MKNDFRPDMSKAGQWRTMVGVAEAALQNLGLARVKHYDLQIELKNQLTRSDVSKEEAFAREVSLKHAVDALRSTFETLRRTRERELKISSNSSVVNAIAQDEIEHSRLNVLELTDTIAAQERQLATSSPDYDGHLKRLEKDNVAVAKSMAELKIELYDSKQAQSQWQEQAEANEKTKERQSKEFDRLKISCEQLH